MSQNIFALTKTSENDGVMGFAEDLMLAKFFGPLLANAYHINVIDAQAKLDPSPMTASSSSWTSGTVAGSPPTYVRSSTVNLDGKKSNIVFDD